MDIDEEMEKNRVRDERMRATRELMRDWERKMIKHEKAYKESIRKRKREGRAKARAEANAQGLVCSRRYKPTMNRGGGNSRGGSGRDGIRGRGRRPRV